MSATRPPRRVSGSTRNAADRLALHPNKLVATVRRRFGFARRDVLGDSNERPVTYTAGGAR
jgi:hypothetical protein